MMTAVFSYKMFVQAQLQDLSTQLAKAQRSLTHYENKKIAYEGQVEKCRHDWETAKADLIANTAKAEEYCARVQTTKPSRHYEQLATRLGVQLRAQEKE